MRLSRDDRSPRSRASCKNYRTFSAAAAENSNGRLIHQFSSFCVASWSPSFERQLFLGHVRFLYRYIVMNDRRARKSPSTGMLGFHLRPRTDRSTSSQAWTHSLPPPIPPLDIIHPFLPLCAPALRVYGSSWQILVGVVLIWRLWRSARLERFRSCSISY